MKQIDTGLTSEEVTQRTEQDQHNDYETKTSKSTTAIFKDNILTLFNLLNLLIGVCLLAVGAYSNLFYLVIILINITVGISQEIHARNLVKKTLDHRPTRNTCDTRWRYTVGGCQIPGP